MSVEVIGHSATHPHMGHRIYFNGEGEFLSQCVSHKLAYIQEGEPQELYALDRPLCKRCFPKHGSKKV